MVEKQWTAEAQWAYENPEAAQWKRAEHRRQFRLWQKTNPEAYERFKKRRRDYKRKMYNICEAFRDRDLRLQRESRSRRDADTITRSQARNKERRRERYQNDPAYRARERLRSRLERKARWEKDPVFWSQKNSAACKASNKRRRACPEFREQERKKSIERYHAMSENAKADKQRKENVRRKQKYKTDPIFRAKVLVAVKKRAADKKFLTSNPSPE